MATNGPGMEPVPGAGGTGCSNPPGIEGQMMFNVDYSTMQYCDGTNWVGIGGVIKTPDAFSFTDLTNQPVSTLVLSDIVQITGIKGAIPTSISGDGSAEYQICKDAACSTVLQAWTSGAATIYSNWYLQLRLTSAATDTTTYTATMTVGTGNANWNVTTNDNAPGAFAFTDQTGVALSTLTSSDIVQITGITGSVATSISGTGSPEYQVCSDATCSTVIQAWTSGAATIQNNQYIQLELTSNASFSTMNSATMTVGTGSDQWDVTSRAPNNCNLPWGGTINDGQNVTAYSSASPPGPCASYAETRTCTDGSLSGSNTLQSCTNGCTGTPWGNVSNGYSNTAYQSGSVPCGSSCAGQTRTCNNGTLSGSYANLSCSVATCSTWHFGQFIGTSTGACPGGVTNGASCSVLGTYCSPGPGQGYSCY